MARKKLFGTKGPLIYATMVSLVCVMAASISTFAWFQAEARVQVQTTSTSTDITVEAPGPITLTGTLYYFVGNGTSGYTDGDLAGTPLTFANFSEATTSAHKSLTNIHPGRKMTFMIAVTASGGNIGSMKLKIKNLTSDNAGEAANRWDVTTTKSESATNHITLANSISIYTACSASAAVPSGFDSASSNQFTYVRGTSEYPIYDGSVTSIEAAGYLFYTVHFDDSASLFSEYTTVAGTVRKEDTPAHSLSTKRYFMLDPTYGDSNCYEGLSFSIPTLEVSLS